MRCPRAWASQARRRSSGWIRYALEWRVACNDDVIVEQRLVFERKRIE
jgi:hypothetical protein